MQTDDFIINLIIKRIHFCSSTPLLNRPTINAVSHFSGFVSLFAMCSHFGMICGCFILWPFSLQPFWFLAILAVDRVIDKAEASAQELVCVTLPKCAWESLDGTLSINPIPEM